MKKVILSLMAVIVLLTSSLSFATVQTKHSEEANSIVASDIAQAQTAQEQENLTPASKKILGNASKKERKIAEYTDKYNDETMATVAYYLDLIQIYSIPVCIIGLAIGALNFYIIGQKKLDKQEKGFSTIMGFLCGLVFFQVLPFIFALLVAGK